MVPGVQEEPGPGTGVVVVVPGAVVVVVVVVVELVVGQVEGQKPYSPAICVPSIELLVLHHGAAWPTLVQEV